MHHYFQRRSKAVQFFMPVAHHRHRADHQTWHWNGALALSLWVVGLNLRLSGRGNSLVQKQGDELGGIMAKNIISYKVMMFLNLKIVYPALVIELLKLFDLRIIDCLI